MRRAMQFVLAVLAVALAAFMLGLVHVADLWLIATAWVFGLIAGIGNVYAQANLNQDLGSSSPPTWWVALLTTMPSDGDATGLVEATWTGYARVSVTNNSTNFPAATVVTHVAQVVCQANINWGTVSGLSAPITVVGLALFTTSTAGNMGRTAVFGTPNNPVSYVLNNGSSISIAAGNLTFQEF